jgi:hypothetical protein
VKLADLVLVAALALGGAALFSSASKNGCHCPSAPSTRPVDPRPCPDCPDGRCRPGDYPPVSAPRFLERDRDGTVKRDM